MSWLNFSWVTPSSSGSTEWQSRQEFFVCACASPANNTSIASNFTFRTRQMLLRKVTIDRHACYIRQSKNCKSCNPGLRTRGMTAFKKRQHQPRERYQAEAQYDYHFAVDHPQFGRDEL